MHIYILNLEVEQKRRYLCEGALFAMNVPFRRIKRWVAKDDQDYEKTSDLLRDAIADGFPGFQRCLNNRQQNKEGIAIYSQAWNYCRFWRHLVENKETAMLIQDDRKLRQPYPRMLEIFKELIRFDPDFEFLSLWCKQEVVHRAFPGRLPFRLISEGSPVAQGIYENGACAGHIITPKGAEVLLDLIPGHSPARVEFVINALSVRKSHFYTLINEKENITHLVDNEAYIPSRILSNDSTDGFLRPIETTTDEAKQ